MGARDEHVAERSSGEIGADAPRSFEDTCAAEPEQIAWTGEVEMPIEGGRGAEVSASKDRGEAWVGRQA